MGNSVVTTKKDPIVIKSIKVGPQGPAWNQWRGSWVEGSYIRLDAVYHNGKSWIANKNTGQEPSEAATDWDITTSYPLNLMLQTVYDPHNEEKEIAFKDELFSKKYGDLENIPLEFVPSVHNNDKHSVNYEEEGVASSLITSHQNSHPVPTNRDTRNEISGAVSTHEGTWDHNRFVADTDERLSDPRTPTSHAIAGTKHSHSTLSELNSKISDAALIDTEDSRLSDDRTPTEHGSDKHSEDYVITTDSRLSDARTPLVHGNDKHAENYEVVGIASELLITHETSHPVPTNRDTRNDPAGAASGVQSNLDTHTSNTTDAHGIDAKVDKITGYSLIADTEIAKIHNRKHNITDINDHEFPISPTNSKYLRDDGSWQIPPDTNTIYTFSTGLTETEETVSVDYGTEAGTACEGNDSRLSDARTPISHDNTHHSENYEVALGNPDTDGKILSSTTEGVRSWIDPGGESISEAEVKTISKKQAIIFG